MKMRQQIVWVSAIFQMIVLGMAAFGDRIDILTTVGLLCILNIAGFLLPQFSQRKPAAIAFYLVMLLGPWLVVLWLMFI